MAERFVPLDSTKIVTKEVIVEILAQSYHALSLVDFKVEPGTDRGDNYLSLMYAVEVTATEKVKGHDNVQKLFKMSWMFKTIPRNPLRQSQIRESGFYYREAEMYQKVLPELFSKFWTNEDDSLFAKCLAVKLSPPEVATAQDYIALEDLKVKGFKMVPRNTFLDLQQATITVQALAKFHAASFCKWGGDGNKILAEFPFLKESQWVEEEKLSPLLVKSVLNTFENLENLLEQNGFLEQTEKLKTFFEKTNVFDQMHHMTSVSNQFPSVLNHGDLWTNNLLFLANHKGESFQKLKMVDFQISKVGSRVLDLSYLFYTSLQKEVLNTQLPQLLRMYFNEFHENIKILTCSKNTEILKFKFGDLSWENFLAEWTQYKLYGFVLAMFYAPPMLAVAENIPDMETLCYADFETTKNEENKFSNLLQSPYLLLRIFNLVEHFSNFQK